MTTPDFAEQLKDYIINVTNAHTNDQAERQISHLFLGFIAKAFNVESVDIELEHHIHMKRVQKHGYIDALFGDLIIEFKRNINTAIGENVEQLANYLRDMPDNHRYIGILTDGIYFQVYVLDEDNKAHKTSNSKFKN